MKYLVKHDTSMSEQQKKEILEEMNSWRIENGHPLLTDTGVPDVSQQEVRAKNRAELEDILCDQYGIDPSEIISVEVLEDDSQQLIKDHEIMALAEEEPTCAGFDWTSDNVMSFARKLLAKYQEAQDRPAE